MTILSVRVAKLEAKAPDPQKQPWRCICIVASDKDEALAFAREQGFEGDREDDLIIINLIVGGAHCAPHLARPWNGGADHA